MGSLQSQYEAEPLTKRESTEETRTYKTPDAREKDRFLTSDTSSGSGSTFETSIDKFDYAIVFDLSEGKYRDPLKSHYDVWKWKDYKEKLLKCIPDEPVSLVESIIEGIFSPFSLTFALFIIS